MTAFLLAVQFLTRIPVTVGSAITHKQLGESVLYYPLVGLLMGAGLVGLSVIMVDVPLPTRAALLLAVWVFITGGLHLDGLADCADAWAGGLGDKQRSLRIMKDPTVGAIAVVTLVIVLLLKWTCLQTVLLQKNQLALLCAPMLGRAAILVLMLSTPYLNAEGLGAALVQNLPRSRAQCIVFIVIMLGIAGLSLIPVLCAGLLLLGVRHLSLQRLQSVTGDVYGASVELVEMAVLIGVNIMQH